MKSLFSLHARVVVICLTILALSSRCPVSAGENRTARSSPRVSRPADPAPAGKSSRPPVDDGRRWLRHPVAFNLNGSPLAQVLVEFAARQGVSATVSPELGGTISGNFTFTNPAEFLDILCQSKQMNWYYSGSSVHFFSTAEMQTRVFSMMAGKDEALRQTLRDLGIYDPHLEWRPADGGRLVMVQGPELYLTRIADVLAKLDQAERVEQKVAAEAQREKSLGVFRLKHAWAAEKTITTSEIDTTVPGVADILRQIITNSPQPSPASGKRAGESGTPRLIKGTGVVGRANLMAAAQDQEAETDDIPFIQADTRINAVLVWDYPENLARYREIIAALDRPLELVEIRAAIIDVEADRSRDLGFTWEYRGENPNWENNAGVNVGENGQRPSIPVVGDGFQYATIYRNGLDSFMARISLMEKDGDANILSRPTVLTQDNIQAVLEHTDTFYVRLQGYEEVDLADIKTGLTLKVTPHVIPAGDGDYGPDCAIEGIQLAVHIVNGSNTADSADASVDTLPRVKQSTITTQAVVGEGEALVIGGYYNEVRSTSRTGVPGLSRIPGIGALFRNKSNIASKSERLFVLSPRIVRMGDVLPPGSEGERFLEESPGRERMKIPALEAKEFRPKTRTRRSNGVSTD